jgi:predicted NAD/FAD-dependent oxidoreductase
VFYPGHLGALPALRSAAFDAADRVALAGDYLYAPTVEGAVTSGLAAAERVASRIVPHS